MTQYWQDALFSKDKQIISGEVGSDGLLVRLNFDAAVPFLEKSPFKAGKWWFNTTFDRIIAEVDMKDRIVANPQLIWQAGFEIIS